MALLSCGSPEISASTVDQRGHQNLFFRNLGGGDKHLGVFRLFFPNNVFYGWLVVFGLKTTLVTLVSTARMRNRSRTNQPRSNETQV